MADPSLFRYRVTFGKTGRLSMLSHLEVTHALERMIRRAQLPFAVTQGFSPHMKIGFGAALPVGVGSTCEVVDLFLTEPMNATELLNRLQQAAPENLMPTKVKVISPQATAASVAYPYSKYEAELTLSEGCVFPDDLVIPEVIEVVREGKPTKEIRVADYLAQGPRIIESASSIKLEFVLEILQTGSLRPDLFLTKLLEANNLTGDIRGICRVAQWKHLPEELPKP